MPIQPLLIFLLQNLFPRNMLPNEEHSSILTMENQIPEKVKAARSEAIRSLSAKNKEEYYRSFMGKEQEVLIERVSRGVGKGYGQHYIPVETAASPAEINTFVKVSITGFKGDGDKLVAQAERIA